MPDTDGDGVRPDRLGLDGLITTMMNYSIVYCITAGLTLVMTPVMIRVARSYNMYDRDNARKVHTRPVPRIGGVAIVLAMAAAMSIALYWFPALKPMLVREKTVMLCIGSAALAMFVLGLIDDIFHLNARVKLLVQVAAAWMVCLCGVRIEVLSFSPHWTLDLGWVSWPLTILWIIGITNAINLVDGLDGLAGGIAMIAAAAIAIFCLCTQQIVILLGLLGLLGSLTGFLFFNVHPARIFMGDSGSLFLGFTLSVSTVVCVWQTQQFSALAVAILALGIPIFDTLFSMMRRLLERRSLFSPDRSHIHHRLLDRGLTQKQVVGFLWSVTIVLAGLGLFTLAARGWAQLVILGCLLAGYVQVFHIVGAVRLREIRSRLQANRAVYFAARQHRGEFEQARLLVSRAQTFSQWWQALQKAAEAMGGARLTLTLAKNGREVRHLSWRHPLRGRSDTGLIRATLPVTAPYAGLDFRLEIELTVDDSLEMAGHRIALFNRLVDEFGLQNLRGSVAGDSLLNPAESTEEFVPAMDAPPADPSLVYDAT